MDSSDDNGILGAIPGQFISDGSKTLEPAELRKGQEQVVVVDTGMLWRGLVVIRYASTKMSRAKHTTWAWVAVHAQKVSSG